MPGAMPSDTAKVPRALTERVYQQQTPTIGKRTAPPQATRRAGSIGNRAETMAFVKGKSGNPSGRPKVPDEVKELAKAHTVEAIRTLAEIMGDSSAPHAARANCAEKLLDRAWGKSEATVNVNDNRTPRDLSTAEILAALATHGVAGAEAGAGDGQAVH